jgi:hypothetical protein
VQRRRAWSPAADLASPQTGVSREFVRPADRDVNEDRDELPWLRWEEKRETPGGSP